MNKKQKKLSLYSFASVLFFFDKGITQCVAQSIQTAENNMEVYYSISRNHNTPIAMLEKLLKDESRDITP